MRVQGSEFRGPTLGGDFRLPARVRGVQVFDMHYRGLGEGGGGVRGSGFRV